MRCELKRLNVGSSGIFSELSVCDIAIFYTIERAYPNLNNEWGYSSKIPNGDYFCTRHKSKDLKYETFLIKDVPNFRNESIGDIIFKVANFQSDLDGCIGIGLTMRLDYPAMVESSKAAIREFMRLQKDIDGFVLTIS